jgi:type I restriction enzyme M protein
MGIANRTAQVTYTASKPLQTTAQQLSGLIKSCRDIMRKDKGLNGDFDACPC